MLEKNKIYNIDCVKGMKQLPNNFIDLTVTSPPYDNLRKYNGFEWDFKATASELYRITKEGGIVVWVVGDQTIKGSESGTSFKQALFFKEIGFNLHDTMIYKKTSYIPLNHNRYEQAFEYMFIFSKGKPKTFNPIKIDCICKGQKRHRTFYQTNSQNTPTEGHTETKVKDTKIKSNVWDIAPETRKVRGHPAVFPLQLAKDHIKSWSNEGDIILDPFMGSGTTAIAALELGRSFIGFEISDEYCKIAGNRINDIKETFKGEYNDRKIFR